MTLTLQMTLTFIKYFGTVKHLLISMGWSDILSNCFAYGPIASAVYYIFLLGYRLLNTRALIAHGSVVHSLITS